LVCYNSQNFKINTGAGMALLDDIKEVVVEQLSVSADEVKEDSKFVEDLGADSLDVVELVMALEEKFDIEIPDDEAEKIQTVADVVAYVENK
jgi:acyl carrier protein